MALGGTKGSAAGGPSGAASVGSPSTRGNAAGGPGGPAFALPLGVSAAMCAAGTVPGLVRR